MKSMRKGFTLIELMIVIAIIAIIAAIAIPNLMQSRIRANEATAVANIKQYGTAQVTFQVGRQGRNATNTTGGAAAYADNFRNLFYGNPVNDANANLALISQAYADAALVESGLTTTVSAPTTATAAANCTPLQGYFFKEPSDAVAAASYYTSNFALLACPANSTSTGNNLYWLDQQGNVRIFPITTANQPAAPGTDPYTANTPTTVPAPAGWEAL